MVVEDDSPAEPAAPPGSPRNLSAWRLVIPYIDMYEDHVKRERVPVFCIDVERRDRQGGEQVQRPPPPQHAALQAYTDICFIKS